VLEIAFARKMPVFGICRGHQVLNVALGGSLYQDISSTYEKESMMHQQRAHTSLALHTVKVEKGTMLFDIFGEETVGVNTFHHQAVKALGKDLIVTAVAPDGIIEAFESKDRTVLGVQWHPELMIHKHANMKKIFEYFIHTMAASYKKSK
jgi:putative glutamine amidotransferase